MRAGLNPETPRMPLAQHCAVCFDDKRRGDCDTGNKSWHSDPSDLRNACSIITNPLRGCVSEPGGDLFVVQNKIVLL